jgi:hypothetical protein
LLFKDLLYLDIESRNKVFLPKDINKLPSLISLSLAFPIDDGDLPYSISKLSNLMYLRLGDNNNLSKKQKKQVI